MSVYIIAEAGVNHNGDLHIAKQLIEKAKEIGADCIKFQTYKSENLVSKDAKKAAYQIKESNKQETQFEMLKRLELTYDEFKELKMYSTELGIDFLSTPFDLESLAFLNEIGMTRWKIPSGEITNLPLIKEMCKTIKPIILSTGMSTLEEIEETLSIITDSGIDRKDITLLHCTSNYPASFHDVNLKAMKTMSNRFKVKIGYSDHTIGIEVPLAAVALGAQIIEKHFTLDKNMIGPDHKASIDVKEFGTLIKMIRNIENALGNGQKIPTFSELKNKDVVRKSIFTSKYVKKNELFTIHNLTTMRPGYGISPMRWSEIIGIRAKRNFKKNEMIEL